MPCHPSTLSPSPLNTTPNRYEHALHKANYASLALRPGAKEEEEEEAGVAAEEEDLYASLNK